MVGIGQGAVSKWERGKAEPSVSELPRIARAVDVTADELLQGIDAQYDATIDPSRHAGTGPLSPHLKGDAVDPASARRIAELEREISDYKARLKRTEDAATRLIHITAGSKAHASAGAASGSRRRR